MGVGQRRTFLLVGEHDRSLNELQSALGLAVVDQIINHINLKRGRYTLEFYSMKQTKTQRFINVEINLPFETF